MAEVLIDSLASLLDAPPPNPDATLLAGINASVTSLTINTPLPANVSTAQFRIRIDAEWMTVTAIGGTGNRTWTVVRGVAGSTAATHAINAGVYIIVLAEGLAQYVLDHAVTSVAMTVPGVLFSVAGSPVTTTGTLALSLLTQTANTVLAGPVSGGAATPTVRALVAADHGTGTASAATFLRGDLTWSSILNVGAAGNVGGFGVGAVTPSQIFHTKVTGAGTSRWLQENSGTAQVSIELSRSGGTASDWILFEPAGSTDLQFYDANAGGLGTILSFHAAGVGGMMQIGVAGNAGTRHTLVLASDGPCQYFLTDGASQLNWRLEASFSASNTFVIASGTSNANPLSSTYTARISVTTAATTLAGNLLFGTDNTYDIGASGATRPRTVYVGTSVVVTSAAAGSVLIDLKNTGDYASIGFAGNNGSRTVVFGADKATRLAPATADGDCVLFLASKTFWVTTDSGSSTCFTIDANGNSTHGKTALAAGATNGFPYMPTIGASPSGAPTAKTGFVPFAYDTTNNKLYVYNGAWKSVTLT